MVIGEETLHLRKSKSVIVTAGIIWALVKIAYAQSGDIHTAETAMRHNLLAFAKLFLFLFLFAATTVINTMEQHSAFDMLRVWPVTHGFSPRTIQWLTGLLAFVISPIADNLTTALLMASVAMAVSSHNFLHVPPVLGMMTGPGLLKFFGYYLKRRAHARTKAGNGRDIDALLETGENNLGEHQLELEQHGGAPAAPHGGGRYNIIKSLERATWDTLMFFYGIILCVGGLGKLGFLALGSELMYGQMGPTGANKLVGVPSAIVDNIPVVFAVLAMLPDMSHGQWLRVALTAGVGGSMLPIGSAAGAAMMGQARGLYPFFAHLK